MRTKSLLLLLSCLLFSSLFYQLIPNFPTKLYSSSDIAASPAADVVYKLHPRGISNSNDVDISYESSSPLLKEQEPSIDSARFSMQHQPPSTDQLSSISSTESTYLYDPVTMYIGSTCKPKYFDNSTIDSYSNKSTSLPLPVFLSAIQAGDGKLAGHFLNRFHAIFPHGQLILYSLNLAGVELDMVNTTCSSQANCTLRQFNFEKYPPHVKDLQFHAFRPIIIHEHLDASGSIIWLNIDHFPLSYEKAINAIIASKNSGVYSWTIQEPTSSLTHPRMFDILKLKQELYYFHRMINPSSLIVLNSPRIHNDLIIPWVKCSLVQDCISPIGAQSSGCSFKKKPAYRYSGCHSYDMSALNVLLGSLFNFRETDYAGNESNQFFSTPLIDDVMKN